MHGVSSRNTMRFNAIKNVECEEKVVNEGILRAWLLTTVEIAIDIGNI
jgi:hypothetical protein